MEFVRGPAHVDDDDEDDNNNYDVDDYATMTCTCVQYNAVIIAGGVGSGLWTSFDVHYSVLLPLRPASFLHNILCALKSDYYFDGQNNAIISV